MNDRIEGQCLRNSIQFASDGIMLMQPFGIIRRLMNTFKCVIRAVTKAVEDTNISRVWILFRRELQMILDKTRSCRSEITVVDKIRYMIQFT